MPTNDNMRKLEKILHDDFLVTPLLMLQLEAEVDKKARSDTAKEIFEELDKINKKPLYPNQKRIGAFIQIKKEDYLALKKKYKVD